MIKFNSRSLKLAFN